MSKLTNKEKEEIKSIYNMTIVQVVYGYHQMMKRIDKAIGLLEKYNDNENNYYVPLDQIIEILKGE